MVPLRPLVAVAACACVGVMMAATVKFKAFLPAGVGDSANPQVDGMATLKYMADTGFTRLHLNVSDLVPNTTYSVMVDQADNPEVSTGNRLMAFTTNHKGHGVFQSDTFAVGNISGGQPRVTLYIWDGTFDDDPFFPPNTFPAHVSCRLELDFYGQTRAESVMD